MLHKSPPLAHLMYIVPRCFLLAKKGCIFVFMRVFFLLLLYVGLLFSVQGQGIYEDPKSLAILERAIQYIYNIDTQAATDLVDSLKQAWPEHPAPDILSALQMYWQESIITGESKHYEPFMDALRHASIKSKKMWQEKHIPEAILFEISARGILAERYANEGEYIKSFREAKSVYNLVLLADKFKKINPDFYFILGLYNYFRVRYPEEYPIYKPLLFFFKAGNKDLGLQQLDTVAQRGILSRPEANTYLAYIYLRYENKPQQSLKYLLKLHETFPNNPFYTSKLAEAYLQKQKYTLAKPLVSTLFSNLSAYYQLIAHYLQGYIEEKDHQSLKAAQRYYKKAIAYGSPFKHKGSMFKANAYLGLGRIAEQQNEKSKAIRYYKAALKATTHPKPRQEAQSAVQRLKTKP